MSLSTAGFPAHYFNETEFNYYNATVKIYTDSLAEEDEQPPVSPAEISSVPEEKSRFTASISAAATSVQQVSQSLETSRMRLSLLVTSPADTTAISPSGNETAPTQYNNLTTTGGEEGLGLDDVNFFLAGFLGIVAILIIFGNLLVIVAVKRERSLRTPTNYFIVSLAVADMLVGLVVLPFSIFLEATGRYWIFGKLWCDFYHAFDVLLCTASILNLTAIAFDRYLAITNPFRYSRMMTKTAATVCILVIWLLGSAISFPCIIWWRAVDPVSPVNQCEFTGDTYYLIISACISFYIPLLVMLFAYHKIYKKAVQQTKYINSGRRPMSPNGSRKDRKTNGNDATGALRIHRGRSVLPPDSSSSTSSGNYLNGNAKSSSSDHDGERCQQKNNNLERKVAALGRKFSVSAANLNREHRAAKMLGIVIGIFAVSWLPFFLVANIVWPVCPSCLKSPHIVLPVVTWLGYTNSLFNVIVYAFSSRRYRLAFEKILCGCCPWWVERSRERSRRISRLQTVMYSAGAVGLAHARTISSDLDKFSLPNTYF